LLAGERLASLEDATAAAALESAVQAGKAAGRMRAGVREDLRGVSEAGAYTRPLLSPTGAVSDTRNTLHTLNTPKHPLTPPYHGLHHPYAHPLSHTKSSS
jgi:hypothetical protein